jgi:RND family efflux transporter MFP subunit
LQPESPPDQKRPLLSVGVSEVSQSESAFDVVAFTGIVKPERSTNLSFARSGRIQTVEVREGETVEADWLLASLDQTSIELKKTGVEQSLQAAKEELTKLDPAGVILNADETRQKLRDLNRELNALNAELSNSGNSADLQNRVSILERQIELMDRTRKRQKIEELRESIAGYESQLKQVEQELKTGLLYAPYPGVITQISVHQGTQVSPALSVMQIASHSLIVQVNVPNSIASGLKESMTVSLQAGSDSFQGSIRAVLPQLDRNTRTRTVLVEVSPESLERKLVPGETVNAQFQINDPQTGIWLPLSALSQEHGERWTVYVVQKREERHVVASRTVEVVRLEHDRVLVQGDLAAGERVIRDGVQRVVPGQIVNIADESKMSSGGGTGENSE